MAQRLMCPEKQKPFWHDKESNESWSSMGHVQVYWDRMASTMKRGSFVVSRVHVVVLNFIVEFRHNLIYSGHTLVRFIPDEYEEDYSTVQGIDEQECNGNPTISKTSKLVPLKI